MSGVSLSMVTLIVPAMDDAIAHYTQDWGFTLTMDTHHISGHRWVVIDPGSGAKLRLVEATNDDETAAIGRQACGRVAFFLNVAPFDAIVGRWLERGIKITEPERNETYGRIVVMDDKYGNRWDVIEAKDARQQ